MKLSARMWLTAAAIMAAAMSPAAAGVNYSLLTTIAIPPDGINSQGGLFNSFDISYVDPVTGYDYVADRSNAAVDIFNGATDTFVGRATGGFTGQQSTTSASGPDGVVVTNNTLFAGNGDSKLYAFNVSNPASPTALGSPWPVSTGGTARTDEVAYSPSANLILVANNADTPAFATLVNATTGAVVAGHITITGSPPNGGLEQPVWDPNTGTFFVSVPAFSGSNDPGGLAEIDTLGNVVATWDFASFGITACSPAGLTLGGSGHLMVGCSTLGSQTVLFDPATGSVVTTLPQISGSDEIYYDPVLHAYFVTGTASGQRAFDVFSDIGNLFLQQVDLPSVNAHSIAVDPLNGHVFVPLEAGGGNTLCSGGCMAVYAQNVPEPGSLPILAVGIAGVLGVSMRRWRRALRPLPPLPAAEPGPRTDC